MEEKEIIAQLRQIFTSLINIKKLADIYKLNSYSFNLLTKLRRINEPLANKLSSVTISIGNSSDINEICNSAKSALTNLAEVKEAVRFLSNQKFIETDEYKRDVSNYESIKNQIESTKAKIKDAAEYQGDLHEKIKRGKYEGCLHARINDNMRLIYYVDPESKTAYYVCIINHNDLDNSFRMKPINWKERFKLN